MICSVSFSCYEYIISHKGKLPDNPQNAQTRILILELRKIGPCAF
jgi:hypothetical protein